MSVITRALISRVGVDLAKNVIQLHAANGAAWARRLRAMGLDARLIAASFVSPYRMEGKSGKNDMTDAAAGCEAAITLTIRPTMRFVPIKSTEQQGVMVLRGWRCSKSLNIGAG